MASTIPALRGRFGSFEYWLATMPVGELLRSITIPRDMPGWESLTLEERYQRDINITRVKREIAPYFANDEHRFSSALILAVLNDDGMQFEPLDSIGKIGGLPHLYKGSAKNMGFITLSGGEVFVPLDGQHRAKALQYAISGTDDNNVPIDGVKGNTVLATEDIAVILVRFDNDRSRRIFNKVNRYAKPTPKGQNLITDDDDRIAVVTRQLVSDEEVVPARLIRIQSNTLSASASEFTTLTTLYDANMAIIRARVPTPGKPEQATPEQGVLFLEEIVNVWNDLLGNIELFAQAVADLGQNGDDVRRSVRKETLLGKPIGQLSLVRAYLLLLDRCPGVSEKAICDRLNMIDWSLGNPLWHGVLMNPNGRVMSGRTTVNAATQFIAYLAGAKLSVEEQDALIDQIAGDQEYQLPPPVVV